MVRSLPAPTRQRFQRMIDKMETNLLLASDLGSTADFTRLLRDGTLDASPTSGDAECKISVGLCAKCISEHAAAALSSSGIKCLDVRGNLRLVTLPVKELCSIASLTLLKCDGCSSLTMPPQSVAKMGGEEAMIALHESRIIVYVEKEDYKSALAMVRSLPAPTRQRFQRMIDKMETNLLLASDLGSTADFKRLLRDGTLDASPTSGEKKDHISTALCARVITSHAAAVILSSDIKCLDVRGNSRLVKMPVEELSSISTLQGIECSGCPRLLSIPLEVAEKGGSETLSFARDCVKNGAINDSLSVFFIGDGEVGKTSLRMSLMNEKENTAIKIGKDTRTVGMDMVEWQTTDKQGMTLRLLIKDVGGQKVYMKTHELFVLSRAIYIYLWRADSDEKEMEASIGKWLNLVQSCVPGVNVLPVCTHVDCASPTEVQRKCEFVKKVLQNWEKKQEGLPNSSGTQIVHILNDGESFCVNCLTGEGVAKLRSAVKDTAEITRGFHEPLPKSWVDLRSKIRQLRSTNLKYIPWAQLLEICTQFQISEIDRVLSVISFLHETMELRFFGIDEMRLQRTLLLETKGDILLSTVVFDAEWMIDILKGIVRHDHAALRQHFHDDKQLVLAHHVRRMCVQGVISHHLIQQGYLWPGISNVFWNKVAEGETEDYKYERELWDDGDKGLKKIVENDNDMQVVMAILKGFKVIQSLNTQDLEYFCPDIVPPHMRDTTDIRSLDACSCPFWLELTYSDLPVGYWDTLFMELRSKSSSGSTSTCILTLFLLSAKIRIMQTRTEEGNIKIIFRASTRFAFEVVKNGLAKTGKFYRGVSLWQVKEEEMSAEESAKIVEPAQVLIMTVAQKSAEDIAVFNEALSKIGDNETIKNFVEGNRPNATALGESFMILAECVDCINYLQSQLNTPGEDHFTGNVPLATMSADIDNLHEGLIRPLYWKCERAVKRPAAPPIAKAKRNQVVDGSNDAVSFQELDQALFVALKKGDKREAEQLLQKGADASFVFSFCCLVQSNVTVANKREDLQELLHVFGCDDSRLKKPQSTIRREEGGNRLKDSLRFIQECRTNEALRKSEEIKVKPAMTAFVQPRSMLGDEDKEMSEMARKFIANFAHVLDGNLSMFQISREVYSQHIPFRGKAQVVIVLLEAGFSRSPDLCARFRELVNEGCKVIGVPMPGFKITDFQKWWPDEMEEFKNFSLFFDCRTGPEGDQWNGPWIDKIGKELMPQVQKYLEGWTESDLTPTENGSDSISDSISANPAPAEQVYLSKEHMRQRLLVCPHCVQLGKPNPGTFKRDACMLAFLSPHTVENSTFYCTVCQGKVKVNHILKRCIFLSYNWGCNNSTQNIAAPLCQRILLETEMTYWLDIKGGMGFGDELITEMREGVAGCVIVLLLISDAFCNSANCLREFVHTANLRKHVIPVLVSDKGPTRTGPSGWTGAYVSGDTDWWKHAERICTSKDPDAADKDIPWSYLASFTPIDLRQESLQADGSLQDDSPAAHDVIERIMKRFFRSG